MAVKKLSELTVAELKHELKKRNLEFTGEKNVLLARLRKSLIEENNKAKLAAAQQQKPVESDGEKKITEMPLDPKKSETSAREAIHKSETTAVVEHKVSDNPSDAPPSKIKSPDLDACKSALKGSFMSENNEIDLSQPGEVASTEQSKMEDSTDDSGKKTDDVSHSADVHAQEINSETNSSKQDITGDVGTEENNSGSASQINDGMQTKLDDTLASSSLNCTISEIEMSDNVNNESKKEVETSMEKCDPSQVKSEETEMEVSIVKVEESKVTTEKKKDVSGETVKNVERPDTATEMKTPDPQINRELKEGPAKSGVNSLWICGMTGIVKASDLKQEFSKHGRVVSAKIVTSAKNPGSRCFGLVTMYNHEEAVECVEIFKDKLLLGSVVTVELDTKHRVTRPQSQMGRQQNICTTDQTKVDTCEKIATNNDEVVLNEGSKIGPSNETITVTLVKKQFVSPMDTPTAVTESTITPVKTIQPVPITKLPTPQITSKPSSNIPVPSAKIISEAIKTTASNSPPAKTSPTTAIVSVTPTTPANVGTNTTTAASGQGKVEISTSVWLSGFPSSIKANELKALCLTVGKVLAAKVVASAKLQTYYGLVTMATVEDAESCVKKLNGTIYKEKEITCEMAPSNNVTQELLKRFSKSKSDNQQQQPVSQPPTTTSTVLGSKIQTASSSSSATTTTTSGQIPVKSPAVAASSSKPQSTSTKPTTSAGSSQQKEQVDIKSTVDDSKKDKSTPLLKNPPCTVKPFRKSSPRGRGNTKVQGNRGGGRYVGSSNNRIIPSLLDNSMISRSQYGQNSRGLLGDRRTLAMMEEERRRTQEMAMINAQREKLQLERMKLERERERMRQEQLVSQRRNEWKPPSTPMKRPHEADDVYWGPPPNSAAKRFAPSTPHDSFGASRRPPLLPEKDSRYFERSAGDSLLGPRGSFPAGQNRFQEYW